MALSKDPVLQSVLNERNQGHSTRKKLFIDLENLIDLPILSFFTSFYHPVWIQDGDVDMIEGLLQKLDLKKGLSLIINSPGGLGMSAERIINVCKSYSGTNDFVAIVPGKAKSAATMICMGAKKIMMGKTSELGPIDPQTDIGSEDNPFPMSLHTIIHSYEQVFKDAVTEGGNLEPHLQQLARYDARKMAQYQTQVDLAEDIAIRALKSGMMKNQTNKKIEELIKVFLKPEKTKTHGRPIYHEEAKNCGLNIELLDHNSDKWKKLFELYIRISDFTSTFYGKSIETKHHSYYAAPLK